MSTINTLSRTGHFEEFNTPLMGGATGTMTAAQRKAAALANLGAAPAAGQALITGVTAGTAAAGKALTLDANSGISGYYADRRTIALEIMNAPSAFNATGTLVNAVLAAGYITSTTAAAVVATLPTATLMDTAILSVYPNAQVGDSFYFTVINTGPNTFTLATAAGWTDGGNAFTAVAATSSAMFQARRTGANAYTLYRIS